MLFRSDNTRQVAISSDQHAMNFALEEEVAEFDQTGLLVDAVDRFGHDMGHSSLRLTQVDHTVATGKSGLTVPVGGGFGIAYLTFVGDQVVERYHADELPFIVDHGSSGNVCRSQGSGQCMNVHIGLDRNDLATHNVLYLVHNPDINSGQGLGYDLEQVQVMKNLEVWWIRHGQSVWNAENRWQGHSDVPLSELGRQQARYLQKALQGVNFDLVFCSDLMRAEETARLALPDAPRVQERRLREMNFGDFEGLTRDEMSEEQRLFLADWLQDPIGLGTLPGGESLQQVRARVENWLEGLPTQGRVAVFTHGGVIRCGLWGSQAVPDANPFQFQVANCSTTCIRYAEVNRIEWINDVSFLE